MHDKGNGSSFMSMCSDREYNLRERIKTIYETLKSKGYADLSTYCREGEQNMHRVFNIHPSLLLWIKGIIILVIL